MTDKEKSREDIRPSETDSLKTAVRSYTNQASLSSQRASSSREDREELRQNLKSKLQAAKISRMNKNSQQQQLNNLHNKVKKEFGEDIDMQKVFEYMQNKLSN